jgi:hypothetical protein
VLLRTILPTENGSEEIIKDYIIIIIIVGEMGWIMEIDNNTLRNLLALDDESFKNIIRQISVAAGADPNKTEVFMSDIPGIKNTLASLSPKDAESC